LKKNKLIETANITTQRGNVGSIHVHGISFIFINLFSQKVKKNKYADS
jgi:hypothetical protein